MKDYRSLVNLFEQISVYEKGSGAKLNRSKTEAMWLGAWRNRTDEPLGLTWVRKMKILGVFLSFFFLFVITQTNAYLQH